MPNNRNQDTTHDYSYTTETMSEIYYINELPEGALPINFNIIDQYQHEDPGLTAKVKNSKYKPNYCFGGSNKDLNIITCEDDFIP